MAGRQRRCTRRGFVQYGGRRVSDLGDQAWRPGPLYAWLWCGGGLLEESISGAKTRVALAWEVGRKPRPPEARGSWVVVPEGGVRSCPDLVDRNQSYVLSSYVRVVAAMAGSAKAGGAIAPGWCFPISDTACSRSISAGV